jgi:hypothetical protein
MTKKDELLHFLSAHREICESTVYKIPPDFRDSAYDLLVINGYIPMSKLTFYELLDCFDCRNQNKTKQENDANLLRFILSFTDVNIYGDNLTNFRLGACDLAKLYELIYQNRNKELDGFLGGFSLGMFFYDKSITLKMLIKNGFIENYNL